jgi:hypothetical protein
MITKQMRRDFQKSKVYAWANNYVLPIDHESLDIVTCQLIADDVLRCYKINRKLPVTTIVSKTMRGVYKERFTIQLQDKGKIRPIVLHEIAHAITRYYYGYSVPSHGKEFVSFFMILLNKWCRVPMSELKRTAELCDVQYIDTKLMRKPNSRMRPREFLRKSKAVVKLPKKVAPNMLYHIIPGRYGGYSGVYAERM